MDATRKADGIIGALKHIRVPKNIQVGREEQIMRLLNSEPLKSHPENPCPPLIEILHVPDDRERQLLVRFPSLRDSG